MIGKILKAAAYMKAPKLTFVSLHPTTALRLRALPLELRYGYGARIGAAVALVAFPLGLITGILISRKGSASRAGQPVVMRRRRTRADVLDAGQPEVIGTMPSPADARH